MPDHPQADDRTAGQVPGRSARRRAHHSAAATRALAAGLSASTAIGLGGLMFHDSRVAEPIRHPNGPGTVHIAPAPPPAAVPAPVVSRPPPTAVPTTTRSGASR